MSLRDWVAPARTALVLVDMQADFAASDGLSARQGHDVTAAQAAVAKAEILAQAARRARVPLMFVRLIARDQDQSDVQREWHRRRGDTGPPLCREGSPGAQFVGPLPQGGDYVVTKARYSGFTGTRMDESLRAWKRDTLVVCGLTTECCVDATVRDAFERDYHVFIAQDACAAYEPGLHQAALRVLEMSYAGLASVSDLTTAWKSD